MLPTYLRRLNGGLVASPANDRAIWMYTHPAPQETTQEKDVQQSGDPHHLPRSWVMLRACIIPAYLGHLGC